MTHHPDREIQDLVSISDRVQHLADKIGAAAVPVTFGRSRQDGTPHVEIVELHGIAGGPSEPADVALGYALVSCERGHEYERRVTAKLDDLLYWIAEILTHRMASEFELSHRCREEDFRRQMFAKQETLMEGLSPDWAERLRQAHAVVIERRPL